MVSVAVFAFNSKYAEVIFVLIMSCATPLIYYLAIEENRRKSIQYFRDMIKIKIPKNTKESISTV